MPQLRQNLVTGEFVIIAPERAKRPQDFIKPKPQSKSAQQCPFCPGGEAIEKEKLISGSTKNVKVIPNLYPAFVRKRQIIFAASDIYFSCQSTGAHEVVIFKDHKLGFSKLEKPEISEIFQVYQKRYQEISQDPEIEYVMLIHNHGEASGATVVHPHSQIFAPSIIPNVVLREIWGASRYWEDQGNCVFCDILKEEKKKSVRIISENKDFLAFLTFAPRMPFEIWLLPKKHISIFEKFSPLLLNNLADCFKEVFKKLDTKLSDPDYNFYFHSMPTKHDHLGEYYHFHIEILPRLSVWGGFELGSGISIDVVSPESAARFLNK